MKKIIVIAIVALLSTFASAQIQTIKGDSLFSKWDFYKAAKAYEKAVAKKPSQDLYYKLGQCYQKMNRYQQAQLAYDKVKAAGLYANATFYLNYGLVLKTNERYAEAKNAFELYNNMMPSDPRGKFYMSSCDVVMGDHSSDLPIKITAVSALNSDGANFSPVIYKNGIIFTSSRKTKGDGSKLYGWDGEYYLDIYYAKRGINDTCFYEPLPIRGNGNKVQDGRVCFFKNFDTCFYEPNPVHGTRHNVQDGPACFSRNFDTIYFNSVSKELRGKEKKTLNIERNKIYSVVNKNGQWVDLKQFQYDNDTFSVATPYLSMDGSKLYFSSDMPGGYGGDDLYYCTRQGNGWSRPVNMGPNINTFGNEKFPAMDDSGNFYFSSDGYKGYGGLDICVSKNINGTFGPASVMKAPFNSAGDDYGITFAKGGRKGYFSSNRNEGNGNEDIYFFNLDKDSMSCPVATSLYIIGFMCPLQQKPLATINTITPKLQPVPEVTPTLTMDRTTMLIHFDYDKYNIRPDAAKTLDSIAVKMRKNIHLSLAVNCYCDWRGTYDYNQVLSNLRSESTVNYMVAKGIDKKRMLPKGYGKTNIISKCTMGVQCTDSQYQVDRRAEMNFYFPAKKEIVSAGE